MAWVKRADWSIGGSNGEGEKEARILFGQIVCVRCFSGPSASAGGGCSLAIDSRKRVWRAPSSCAELEVGEITMWRRHEQRCLSYWTGFATSFRVFSAQECFLLSEIPNLV